MLPDTAERTDWEAKRAQLQKAYEDREAKIEDRESRETLVQAITQLAAGLYGLRTGMDLSGVKFDKKNWEAKYDRSMRQLGLDEDALARSQRSEEDRISNELRRQDEGRAARARQLWNEVLSRKEDIRLQKEREHDVQLKEMDLEKRKESQADSAQQKIEAAFTNAQGSAIKIDEAKKPYQRINAYSMSRSSLAKVLNNNTIQTIDQIVRDEDDVDSQAYFGILSHPDELMRINKELQNPNATEETRQKAQAWLLYRAGKGPNPLEGGE